MPAAEEIHERTMHRLSLNLRCSTKHPANADLSNIISGQKMPKLRLLIFVNDVKRGSSCQLE